MVASIIGNKHASDENDDDNSNVSLQPGKGIKRLAINNDVCDQNGSERSSIEPEPSKKPKLNEVNERNEKDKNILDEEYQTTLS